MYRSRVVSSSVVYQYSLVFISLIPKRIRRRLLEIEQERLCTGKAATQVREPVNLLPLHNVRRIAERKTV